MSGPHLILPIGEMFDEQFKDGPVRVGSRFMGAVRRLRPAGHVETACATRLNGAA